MDQSERDKKLYEFSVLAKTEDELPGLAAFVGQHGGEVVGAFNPKRIAFAYPIKKQRDGIFAYMTFRAYGEDAKKLEEDLRTRQDLLRFLIISLKSTGVAAAAEQPAVVPRRRAAPSAAKGLSEAKAAPQPLSNEALEKKIEEILQ